MMGPVFIKAEQLPKELQPELLALGAQPFTSRGIDGATLNDGFVIAAVGAPALKLLRDFIIHYFKFQSTSKKSLQIKYKGATITGYDLEEALTIIDRIQQS
jgi:hypothetical protein